MKYRINLFTFLVLFIASVMFLTMPVSAIVYESMFDDPIGLGCVGVNEILVCEGTSPSELVIFDTTGTGSTSTNIMNITNYLEDACIGKDGNIYFVLTDGRVYKFTGGGGLYDFYDDYTANFLLLGDMDSINQDRSIVIDDNGNIYATSENNIYKFTYPSLTPSIYETDTNHISGNYVQIISLAFHKNGIVYGERQRAYTAGSAPAPIKMYIVNDSGTTLIRSDFTSDYILDGHYNQYNGIYSTHDGDVYYTVYEDDGVSFTLCRLNYSDSYTKSTIADLTHASTDLYIDDNGIIYVSSSSSDEITTYSTYGLSGGYGFYAYPGATGKKQLDYDVAIVDSLYTAYNNDSVIELVYNIDIDLVQGITAQDFYGADGYPDYYYVVDVLDPDGIKQKSSIINTFNEDYNIVSGWHVISTGTLQYSSNAWQNGTWSAILYEYDTNTGLRASLDSCEFEIYDQISDTTISDDTPGIDPTLAPINRIDALLESNAFIGLLIILACIGAFGKVGGIVGVVLGTVAGVSLAALLGYIPAWILFVMIMALCVVFTSKLIGVFGGGNE